MIARNPPTNIKPPAISDEIQVLTPDIYFIDEVLYDFDI